MSGGTGWGAQSWGNSAWGGALSATLQLVAALAVAENAVQLTFNQPLYWSGLLDPTDASQPALWRFQPLVDGPLGQDGTIARPVGAAAVSQVSGTTILVTLDRPLTPAPATYYAVASPLLQVADQSQSLNPAYGQQLFTSVFKKLVVPSLDAPSGVATRDIASPVGRESAVATGNPVPSNILQLGTPVLDDTGDYATDYGLVGLKKRVLRRILFAPGATLHLGPGYGAGALTYAKKLNRASNRSVLAAACEAQIAQEPDVAAVSVTIVTTQYPGLVNLVVLVQSRYGKGGFKLLVPVQQSGAPALAA
jgi:hypothetical protein